MNKVYLSGIIANPPVKLSQGDEARHVSFPVCVSHRTKQGATKRELYNVQAWNGVAEWAHANLNQGQRVMLQGYLTQHRIALPDGSVRTEVEVTAEEFFSAVPKRAQRNAVLEGESAS